MIDFFESSVRIHPDDVFFTFTDENGNELSYTYWQARLISASLARKFQAAGLRAGDTVSVDLPNCPEFVFVVLACAYCGLTMVLIDNMLSTSDKASRLLDIERSGRCIECSIDSILVGQVLRDVRMLPDDEVAIVRGIYSPQRHERAIMGVEQDAIDDTIHYAERAAHLFDRGLVAVIVFSYARSNKPGANRSSFARQNEPDFAGRFGKPKAVPLTWANLIDSSIMVNDALAAGAVRFWQERLPLNSVNLSDSGHITQTALEAVWQCVLPLSSIDGLQVLVRSAVARSSMRLYSANDVELILHDCERGLVSHIAVDDALLQDILTVEEWRSDVIPGAASRISRYRCMLLVGRVINARTIMRAYEMGCRIFASYGLPQASGTIATALLTEESRGGIIPIEGYEVRIVDPDEDGYGRLAVRGPGVFDGYLNGRAAFTVDHFFITEEKVAEIDGYLHVRNRAENMFVSAGQNIYPIEIADVLRHVSGVSGVHVFGVPDSSCGQIPVAVIERSDPALTSQAIEHTTRQWFSTITVPIRVFVFDQLPRDETGKLDRAAIESMFSGQQ